MAKALQYKFDATKPFYAWVGAADLTVEKMRDARSQYDELVQEAKKAQSAFEARFEARLEELQAELKALPKRVESVLDDLRDAKSLPAKAQTTLEALQAEAKSLRVKLEARAEELRADFTASVEEQVEAFDELATRGEAFVAKLRDRSISGNVEIIDDSAEVVKDVDEAVEQAAAEAAEKAAAAADVAAVKGTRKARATKKPSA